MQTTTVQVQDRFITANGLRFHYREWGDPGDPALLILHGITGHSWEFDHVAERLANRFHVFAFDERGHGASDWASRYGMHQLAEDTAALIASLDLDRVTIVGHSMGGINGYLTAARNRHRVERLVVMDVGPNTVWTPWAMTKIPAMLEYYADAAYDTPDDAVAEYLGGNDGPTAAELRRFVLNNLRPLDDDRWTWRFDAAGLRNSFVRDMPDPEEQWAAIRAISCPTLIVRAEQSEAFDAAEATRMAQELPDGRLVEIAGAGHDVHIDQFEPFMTEVCRFLAGR